MGEPGRVIKAIVFDTNVFGKSVEPNSKLIAAWAEVCDRHDAELWIPEPVALELAERVTKASRDHIEMVNSYNARRRKWGFRPVPPPPEITPQEAIEAIENSGGVVIEVSGEVAQAALRDQILVQGAGSTTSGVKTGAADSAWARAVVEYNGGDAEGLVVVTGDRRAAEFLHGELGVDPETIVANIGEILDLLSEQTVADETQVKDFIEALPDEPDDSPWLLELTEIDDQWHFRLPQSLFASPERYEIQGRTYTLQGAAHLLTAVEYDAWSQSLTARVVWTVLVEEQYVDLDTDEVVLVDDYAEIQVRGDAQVMFDAELGAWIWTVFENAEIATDE